MEFLRWIEYVGLALLALTLLITLTIGGLVGVVYWMITWGPWRVA